MRMSKAFYLHVFILALLWPGQNAAATDPSLDAIRAAVLDYAQKHAPASNARIDIAQLDPRLRLTPCGVPLAVIGSNLGLQAGRNTANVRCTAPQPWQIYVPFTLAVSMPVLVATRSLARGQAILATDIKLETRELAHLKSGYITDPSVLVGQQLRQDIAGGAVISHRSLTPVLHVHRGTPVTLLIGVDTFEIRASGTALEDGREGAMVRVRNDSSKKIVRGQVIDKDVVRVGM